MTEAITVKDAARILGISARMMYSLAAPAGDVSTIGQNSPTTHGPSPAARCALYQPTIRLAALSSGPLVNSSGAMPDAAQMRSMTVWSNDTEPSDSRARFRSANCSPEGMTAVVI